MNLMITDGATEDLLAALQSYQQRERTLAEAFLAAFEETLQAIERKPYAPVPLTIQAAGESAPDAPWHSVRRVLCKRFPYAVFYQVESDQIRILAVLGY